MFTTIKDVAEKAVILTIMIDNAYQGDSAKLARAAAALSPNISSSFSCPILSPIATTLIDPIRAPTPAANISTPRPPAPTFNTSSAKTGISDWNGPTVRIITMALNIRNRSVDALNV